MKSLNQRRSNESGFTLIELLIAMVLLIGGIMSFVKFSGNMVNKNGYQMKRTVATTLAAEKIEDLKNTSTNSTLSNGTGTDSLDLDGNTGGVPLFTRTWTISGTSAETNLAVSVSWNQNGVTKTVTLQTLINQ